MDEDISSDVVRVPAEVAQRALALFASIGVALGTPREDVLAWLSGHGLYDQTTPMERAFLEASEPSHKQRIAASWWSERLIVLLWALKVANLPPANEQCDTTEFQIVLPPYADIDPADFVARAHLRTDDELNDMAEAIFQQHWEARDAQLHGRLPPIHVDPEVVQERHHAINWIIGYMGQPWDDVTTDT